MIERNQAEHGVVAAPSTPNDGRLHRPYQAPRITKKRPVARATLFTGSGPDSGGVVSA